MSERDILTDILAGRQWNDAAEAFSESTGVVVAVLRPGHEAAPVNARCPVCLRPAERDAGDSAPCLSCFPGDVLERAVDRLTTFCAGGVPCVLRRAETGASPLYVLVSGFVTSEVERRDLLARLLARGLAEKQARAIARATPVIRPGAALALARLAASHLDALARSALEEDEGTEQILEYELLYEMGRGLDANLADFDALCETILERALKLTSAETGALLLLCEDGQTLETVAARGEPDLRPPACCSLGEGPIGRAAETGRSILVSGFAGERRTERTSSLAVPLGAGGSLVGVLSVAETASGRPLAGPDLKLMERYAESAATALENARRYRKASDRVLELMQLNELSKALNADTEFDRISYLVASVLDKMFEFEVGGLILLRRGEHTRVILRTDVCAEDLRELAKAVTGEEVGPEFIERCAVVPQNGQVVDGDGRPATGWTVLAEPVSAQSPRAGWLFLASRSPDAFTAADSRLLHAQAGHAALALDKAHTYSRLRRDLDKVVRVLSATADAAERTQRGHADRVMDYAVSMGQEMDLRVDDLEALRFAGLLHDIGKLSVSDEIILKPARLTNDEMRQVRRHSEIGAGIVDQMDFLESVAPIILHHHERWDGGGYPGGLAGEAIPLLARILAVADAFDAMTCERSYSKALPFVTARIELERGAGEQFDPVVVEAFLSVLDRAASAGATGAFAPRAAGKPQLLA